MCIRDSSEANSEAMILDETVEYISRLESAKKPIHTGCTKSAGAMSESSQTCWACGKPAHTTSNKRNAKLQFASQKTALQSLVRYMHQV